MRARVDRSVSYRLHPPQGESRVRYHLHVFTQPKRHYWGAALYHAYDMLTAGPIIHLIEPIQRRWHYRDGFLINNKRWWPGCQGDCGGEVEWFSTDRYGRQVRRMGRDCSWLPWSVKQDLRCFDLGRRGRTNLGEIEVNATVYRSVR